MENSDAALLEKIGKIKKEKNAVILAHNFQLAEVQDAADFVGESLELVRQALTTEADVIVLCGVRFMAETAAIVSPGKTVLLPDKNAGCLLADMITVKRLREKKKEHPGATVVCYINTPAGVKALSDICCTATNAVPIIDSLPADKEIMFVPDQYLGDYVATQTGRDLILWPGFCSPHIKIRPEDITREKEAHPDARVIVHMECIPLVKARADAVLSSGGIVEYARQTDAREIIVGTETGILHRLRKENPDKTFIAASERATCAKMRMITLDTILWSLESMTEQIKVPERTRVRAKKAVDRMLEE